MKNKKNIPVSIEWVDVVVYRNNKIHEPARVYTEGELCFETENYYTIKNPETILFDESGPKNHPEKKANFYCIPKPLVNKITYHGN